MKSVMVVALDGASVSMMTVLYLSVVVIFENAVKLLPPSARNCLREMF